MAFGKWSMYLGAVIFLLVGLGSLAVAAVPGADEWVAEQTLDAVSPGTAADDEAVRILTSDDIGGVRTTAWILAASFLPCAALFVFIGRWFRSMEGSFDSIMQTSAQMARNSSAMYQQYGAAPTVVPGSGVITNVGGGVVTSPLPPNQPPPV